MNIVIALLYSALFEKFVVQNFPLFLLTFILGNIGLAIASTIIAAIIAKAGAKGTLYPVLTFPILLPLILTCVQLTLFSLSLMEQTSYRQVEVRSLACRSLCYFDIFEPALASLGDEQHRAYWHAQLDALQSRLARGGESAGKLRVAVDKLFLDHAADVWRLICGYSPDQLAMGGASELVEDLSSSSMTVRVLAYESLRRITGKTQLFRPEEPPEQERSKVLKWRKIQEDGQIVYITPPSPVPFPPAGGEGAKPAAPAGK